MAQLKAKHGLWMAVLTLGFLMLSPNSAQAQLRDNRLGILVTFPGQGAVVVGFLPGSPAFRSGLQINDRITKVEDHQVNNPGSYQKHVGKAGKIVKIHVKRGRKDFNLQIGN